MNKTSWKVALATLQSPRLTRIRGRRMFLSLIVKFQLVQRLHEIHKQKHSIGKLKPMPRKAHIAQTAWTAPPPDRV